MERIMFIAKKHKLFVVEDCAEAHGAEFGGQKVGSFGDIATFSFFANKVLTTGEGGICLTQNMELASRICKLRDHGMSKEKRYWHDVVGYNYRLTNMQAAVGLAQLERVDAILQERYVLECAYRMALEGNPAVQFQRDDLPGCKKITWMVSLLCENRDDVMEKCKAAKVEVRPFFYPLGTMPIYRKYLQSERVAESISPRGLCIPTHKAVNKDAVQTVKEILG
jgi:perosamine synthetase